jgi:hypothetical protein
MQTIPIQQADDGSVRKAGLAGYGERLHQPDETPA